MPQKTTRLEADVVIAGGGTGGCTVARELARIGKRVILLERGGKSRACLGNPLGIFLRVEKQLPFPTKRTRQGNTLIVAQGLGGGTMVYAGSAFLPRTDYWERHGIQIPQNLVEEALQECWVNAPPEEFIGPGTRRIWQAAGEVGLPFERLLRHVDFSRCRPGCEKCTFGCPKDAKWTAREFARQAVESGATLLTRTEVTEVMVHQGTAQGVRARGRTKDLEIHAPVVVCSAGGVHTARILQRSGFPEAGQGFRGDPTLFSFGFVSEGPGNAGEHSMTIGMRDPEHGIVYCSMASPLVAWHVQLIQDQGLKALRHLHRFGQVLSVFAKISDQGTGSVSPDNEVSKTFTEGDHQRFEHARQVNTKILVQAGCDPQEILHSGYTLGHPSATVRVGHLLDTNLETSVRNLYCCDTSVFPEAPGLPPVLTIVVLAKRLSQRICDRPL